MARFTFSPVFKRLSPVRRAITRVWRQYRKLALWLQWVIGILVVVGLLALGSFLSHLGAGKSAESTLPTVTLSPVAELSGGGSSVGVIGTVRSVTEADILAQSGGTVQSVRAKLGQSVPAGYIIAELDNAAQRAAVLQAEGQYDGAVAAAQGASPKDVATSALNTYTSSYNSLDSTVRTYVDAFYGTAGPFGPQVLISPSPYDLNYFSLKRQALQKAMDTWRIHLATASSQNAPALLDEADAVTRQAVTLVTELSTAANQNGSDADATQKAALISARTGLASLQASINAAKQANQSQGTSATLGVQAGVKTALGTLRAAQAALEKTYVRAPIGGQVNFLPIRTGDYVAPLTHVATVAQNGALEIVTNVSEENRALVAVGSKVTIEEKYSGIVTEISPALDPVTKQIEVHVAVTGTTDLVNGQAVHIGLPSATIEKPVAATGPILLPLTALKLTPTARVVFSVDENGKLVAHPVEIGDVKSDRIEVKTELPGDLRIVTDARGLSEGEKVSVAQ